MQDGGRSKKTEEGKKKDSDGFTHYNGQIYIDFVHNGTAEAFKQKWKKEHPNDPACIIVDGNDILKIAAENDTRKIAAAIDFLKVKYDLKTVWGPKLVEGSKTRVYIDSHGQAGAKFLIAGTGKKIEKIDLEKLAKGLNHLIGDNKNVEVNLLACSAGRGKEAHLWKDTSKDSAAAQLHKLLVKELKRDIPVVARMETVRIRPKISKGWYFLSPPLLLLEPLFRQKPGDKYTENLDPNSKKTLPLRKQAGSKVVFSLDERGNQKRSDAYYEFRWKKKVLQALTTALNDTEVKDKEGLKVLIKKFSDKTTDQIADELKNNKEVRNVLEVVGVDQSSQKQSSGISKYFRNFRKKTDILTSVEALLKERDKLLLAPHTIKEPISTGRNLSHMIKKS